jgi:hypothetical protein
MTSATVSLLIYFLNSFTINKYISIVCKKLKFLSWNSLQCHLHIVRTIMDVYDAISNTSHAGARPLRPDTVAPKLTVKRTARADLLTLARAVEVIFN